MKLIKKYSFSIFCSISITILCFIPGDTSFQPEFEIPYFDKFVHFCFYFVLSLTIQYEVKNKVKLSNYLLISMYAVVLGGFIELIQENYIIERSGDFFDLLADLSGAIIAFFVYKSIIFQDSVKHGFKG